MSKKGDEAYSDGPST